MKRILTITLLFMIASFASGQSVYMHEAAEEADKVGHISLWDIGSIVVIAVLCLLFWHSVKRLSQIATWKIIGLGVGVILAFLIVFAFSDMSIEDSVRKKRILLEKNSYNSFMDKVLNMNIILQPDLAYTPIEVTEIDKFDYGSDDSFYHSSNITTLISKKSFDHSGAEDGVFYCYSIEDAPKISAYFFENDSSDIFRKCPIPSLYKSQITPCFIRFFVSNPNVKTAVKRACIDLFNDLKNQPDCITMRINTETFAREIENEYYTLYPDLKKSSLWNSKKTIDGYVYGRNCWSTKEFCSLKYDNCEVMFGISEEYRYYLGERRGEGAYNSFGKISNAEEDYKKGKTRRVIIPAFGIIILIIIGALIRKKK